MPVFLGCYFFGVADAHAEGARGVGVLGGVLPISLSIRHFSGLNMTLFKSDFVSLIFFLGLQMHTLKGHKGSVYSVAFSPGGKRIASGSEDPLAIYEPTRL